ncbi:MAG: ABC transporter ATP-binding protein [Chloroflexota bacterium]
MSGGPVVIRTRGLEKRYPTADSDEGKLAVRSLDLDIRQGEVFGLLGPNGAGKTTTILMLLGLSEPTGGTAEVLGFDPLRDPLQVKRHVGYLPDNVGFYGGMTGRENLRYTARLNGLKDRESAESIDRLLTRVGLADAADRPVETYSRGMRQRLGLADVLVKEPAVVILDEPTTSIDPVGVQEVLELVRGLARDQGVSVLLSSHLLHQVQQVCDRIAIFVEGEVVAMGTVGEIAARQQRGANVTVDIGTDGPGDAVASVIQGVPGVVGVEREPTDSRLWSVTCPPDVRGRVLAALLGSGHVPWLVRDRGMELDEIYQRYFSTASTSEEVAA